jgi:hypothetical protein
MASVFSSSMFEYGFQEKEKKKKDYSRNNDFLKEHIRCLYLDRQDKDRQAKRNNLI